MSWLDACKKERVKVDEKLYPPMNQEKYDSPGLFPKLRKGKSLQPKTDEEFDKIIDAKARRIIKKRLAAAEDSPIQGTPPVKANSPKVRKDNFSKDNQKRLINIRFFYRFPKEDVVLFLVP